MPELCIHASDSSPIESVVTQTCSTSVNLITSILSIQFKDDARDVMPSNDWKQLKSQLQYIGLGVLLLGAYGDDGDYVNTITSLLIVTKRHIATIANINWGDNFRVLLYMKSRLMTNLTFTDCPPLGSLNNEKKGLGTVCAALSALDMKLCAYW